MIDNDAKDMVLKAWDTYQSLIAALGDACWKIRSVFYTSSFAIIAAAFSSNLRLLYLLNPILAVLFCLLEAGYQEIQEQYIDKTIQIERTINDMLAGEKIPYFPDDGISTSLRTPSTKDLVRLFKPKKYLFWLSYITVIVLSLILFWLDVTKSHIPT